MNYCLYSKLFIKKRTRYSQIRCVQDCYEGKITDFRFSLKNKKLKKLVDNIFDKKDPQIYPVFLSGKSGSGKTFLADCIVKEMSHRGKIATRITCEMFLGQLIEAVGGGNGLKAVIESYSNCDLIVIDEMENLQGKIATQEATAMIINHLFGMKVKVILMGITDGEEFSDVYSKTNKGGTKIRIFHLDSLGKFHRFLLVNKTVKQAGLSISVRGINQIVREENMGCIIGMLNCLFTFTLIEREYGGTKISYEKLIEILGRRFLEI